MNLIEFSRLVREQCSSLPKDFLYIKSVGRAFTTVKENQMSDLKVRHFCTPDVIHCSVLLVIIIYFNINTFSNYRKFHQKSF